MISLFKKRTASIHSNERGLFFITDGGKPPYYIDINHGVGLVRYLPGDEIKVNPHKTTDYKVVSMVDSKGRKIQCDGSATFEVANSIFNISHPDIAGNIEFGFECAGVKYYRAIKDFQLPVGRYKWLDAFLYEAELRMNLKTLNSYMDEIEKQLDGSKGTITISKAFQIIWAIRSRCKLAFTPETIKRLASVVFFDESEDLSDYNQEYCDQKIKFWEKHGCYDFFLTKPIVELLNLEGTSRGYLETYIAAAQQVLKDLIFDPEKQSSVNT